MEQVFAPISVDPAIQERSYLSCRFHEGYNSTHFLPGEVTGRKLVRSIDKLGNLPKLVHKAWEICRNWYTEVPLVLTVVDLGNLPKLVHKGATLVHKGATLVHKGATGYSDKGNLGKLVHKGATDW